MKQVLKILISFIFFCNLIAQSPDPFIIHIEEEKIPWSDEAIYHFKVSNFNQISSFQFSIHWDTLLLHFMNVNMYAPGDLNFNSDNFVPNGPEQGFIATLWIGDYPLCKDLEDETSLMSFRFKNPGGMGKFSINNSPVIIEVVNCDGDLPDIIFIDNHGGLTYLNGGVIAKTENLESGLISIYPNPAKDRIFLSWNQISHIPDRAIIYNLQGKIIGHSLIQDKTIEIPSVLSPGIYLMALRNSGQTVDIKRLQIQN